MSHRLRDNISSDYVAAANRLNSRRARRRIVAYVESYDDVFFWRSILTRFEDSTRYFEVMLPSRLEHLERGKKAAVMSLVAARVGSDMIACVDADYDWLMQRHTGSSRSILDNPYVFHSYAYAIENMQCYAPSLHDVCVAVTLNDHLSFDFVGYFSEFSKAVFPLFVWNIWFYRTGEYSRFTLTDFLRVIDIGSFSVSGAMDGVAHVRRKAERREAQLRRQYPEAREGVDALRDELLRLGVRPETTYLYIQGHHLFDKVVVPMLRKICSTLVRERETEIGQHSKHDTQRRNELSCYSSSVADVTFMLKKNVGYIMSEPYQRIVADVGRYLGVENEPQEA